MALPSQWTTLTPGQIQYYLDQPPLHPLRSSSWSRPFDIHTYDELVSTNQTLWELIQQEAKEGTVAIAHQQSAGKGQWGRQWQSSPGGLYLSLALEPHLLAKESSHLILSTVCGVALALRACHLPVSIKWPNDLVVDVQQSSTTPTQLYKLGGILTETRIKGGVIRQAVVGIGLNGANPVPTPGINLMDAWSWCSSAKAIHQCSSSKAHPPQSPLAKGGSSGPPPLQGGVRGGSSERQPLPSPLDSLNGLAAIAIHGIYSGWKRLQQDGIAPILEDYNTLFIHRDRIVEIEWEGQAQWVQVLTVDPSGNLRVRPTFKPEQGAKSDGTSSDLQSSREEIRIPPGTIQLGYRTPIDAHFYGW